TAYLDAIARGEWGGSLAAKALAQRRTAFVSDAALARAPAPLELSADRQLRSVIATPIAQEQRTLGVLMAGSRERAGYFSEKFLEAFQALGSELALSISNARLYEEVRELNRTLEEKVRERTRELEAANQNLQELDRLKSEFLANMSHELRTPMNSILGYTQLVLDGVDGPVTAEQAASLSRVESNARHLLQLINDILDLSRIEAGRLELDVHEFDLGELAREVVEDLETLARRKALPCFYEASGGDLRIEADPNRTREVLNNLVNNAIKFTDRGEVRVRAKPALRGGEEGVEVVVSDTGIGIPPESLEEIFVAFRQLDSSSTRPHGGTGLGLSIAKRLVELHGGVIEVSSRLGEGSDFTIWLPREGQAPGG
ncbi:MAG: GAF domain-containing protein, partial [Deltaproteobacteria bacterium]|nr:GAF domain-containing protein [Deltaproteobacteria bacterium]